LKDKQNLEVLSQTNQKKKSQISKIRERGHHNKWCSNEIHRIISENFKNLILISWKTEEINKYLDAYGLSKLNQEDRLIMRMKETKAVIVSQQRKVQERADSLLNAKRTNINSPETIL
jgi:hypothetical protein